MVLTRAQAKAEAEAQAARGNEDDHDEDTYDPPSADAEYPDVADAYETEDMTDGPSRDTASALVVAEKSGANIFPGVEEHLEKLAGSFLVQARYLVEGHAMLQSQQEGQSNAQSAALMAVQDSTETCIKELTDRQLAIAEVVGERLRDPAADISAEIKQSLKRSVKTIIELISVAVDCNAQTDEEIKTEIENHGNISEDDGDENYDELSEEDRYAQQRMRDALIRA
ncbi:hypothetical protein KRP22_004811 [Phytophthora ramorum]|nr:hypothetical protein KRP22_10443 [Phytophthora ramorum]